MSSTTLRFNGTNFDGVGVSRASLRWREMGWLERVREGSETVCKCSYLAHAGFCTRARRARAAKASAQGNWDADSLFLLAYALVLLCNARLLV